MKLKHPTNLTNFSVLEIEDVKVFFSYETPIAIVSPFNSFIAVNEWGATTGKHINYVKREYPNVTRLAHEQLLEHVKDEVWNAYE